MKKVVNIVFYKFFSEKEDVQIRDQACIFYDDGTVASVSVDEAIEAAHQIAVEEKIKTKEEFKESVNKVRIHVMSGEDFERRFQEFVVKAPEKAKVKELTPADYHMTQEAWDDYIAEGFVPGTPDFDGAVILDGTGKVPSKEKKPAPTALVPVKQSTDLVLVEQSTDLVPVEQQKTPTHVKTTGNAHVEDDKAKVEQKVTIPVFKPPVPRLPGPTPLLRLPEANKPGPTPVQKKPDPTALVPVNQSAGLVPGKQSTDLVPVGPQKTPTHVKTRVTPAPKVAPASKVAPVVVPIVPASGPKVIPRFTPPATPGAKVTSAPGIMPATIATSKVTTAKPKKKKKKNIFQRAVDKLKKNKVVRNIAIGATALAIALFGYSCGARHTQVGQMATPPSIQQTMLQETSQEFLNLLKQTKNQTQKDSMIHASYMMDNFNTTFANANMQPGSDVKAALTWDEMMALNLAYNDYSPEQLSAMFNGAEVDVTAFSNAYKNGTLQLMGAYVIADDENPVNSYKFLQDEQQQEFVKKYEYLFYACKSAQTEEEMIERVNMFYAELHKDFPITEEVRTQGISHAEGRDQIEPYKLAVTPIVAASEMMFQNLDINHTLSDKAIDYFNDLGLCNLADSIFEKAMYITLTDETDEKNPTYVQFKVIKITELEAEDSYNIGDEERDLSQLDEFKYWVNGYYLEKFGDIKGAGRVTTSTHTSTHTTTRTETSTHTTDSREEAVRQVGELKVEAAENEVNAQLDRQNEEARKQAAAEAERKRQAEQAKADAERRKHEEQVRKEQNDLQGVITDANQVIQNGGTVNEDYFGDHNVQFDDGYSDEYGNLDPSVENITTDGTGAVYSYTELPDADSLGETSTSSYSATSSEQVVNTSDQQVIEYEVPVSYEQIVDEYIRYLEQGGQQNTSGAGYSKNK